MIDLPSIINVFHRFAAACGGGGNFLNFPKWYKYLNGTVVDGRCVPSMEHLSDIWLVVAAFIEILLRIGGILAIIFIIYGGIQYISSQGEPDKTNHARQTIINAVIGLVISISATIVVTYLAGRFS